MFYTYLLEQRSPTILAPGTSFVEGNSPMGVGVGDVSGGNGSDGEWCGTADEASLWAASFLTGCRQVAVRSPGVGDACVIELNFWVKKLSNAEKWSLLPSPLILDEEGKALEKCSPITEKKKIHIDFSTGWLLKNQNSYFVNSQFSCP